MANLVGFMSSSIPAERFGESWNFFRGGIEYDQATKKGSKMKIDALQLVGKVERVLVAHQLSTHVSLAMEKIKFIQGHGVIHDNHGGPRLVDIRDTTILRFGLPKGMECFNTRQWSAVSQEELNEIAGLTEIPSIDHGLLGENLVVSGIPRFTQLPSGTQLFFKGSKGELRSTVLSVHRENNPCQIPAEAIQNRFPEKERLVGAFTKHAKRRRGVVGFVLCSGFVKEGDTVIAEVPEQQLYER